MWKLGERDVAQIASSLSAETITLSTDTVQVADQSIYQGKVIRIQASVDCFYNLTGTTATGADPDIPIGSSTERYEFVPQDGGLSFYGTGDVTIVLMG